MIQPETWKMIDQSVRSVWGVIGPLIGILIGTYLSKRSQRVQWIADNKKAEYRELLTTLTKTFIAVVHLRAPGVALGPQEQRTLFDLEAQSLVVIRDRIFIARDVKDMKLVTRWNNTLRDYDSTLDADAFDRSFQLITADLQKSAIHIIK